MKEYLTYDDVLLVPQYSEVLPSQVDLSTKFSRHISLRIPIVSAAMDTVTECAMAIALAREGGIGVIHKNMSIDKQAEEVERVKRFESGMIQNPIVLYANSTVKDAISLMEKHNISGLPVVEKGMKLLGLITKRDILFEEDSKKKVSKLMTPFDRLVTGKEGITIEEAKRIFQEKKVEKLPIIKKNRILTGLITVKDILKRIRYPQSTKDEHGRLRCAAAVGVSKETVDRTKALLSAGVDAIIIDTAHGHSRKVFEIAKKLRGIVDVDLIVGNVASEKAVKDILSLDVDAIKVGVGPGSICTTRVIAGIGVPQLSAIMETSNVSNVPIIADGGIKYSGDITKALAAGASSVMIGSLLAGTEESPGESVIYEGRRFKVYRGMGSLDAMKEGSSDRYFQEGKLVPEGVVARVPYKGPAQDVIFQLIGGVRSGMGYIGAKNISILQKRAKFIKITAAGLKESHPHDVVITKEPPNYEIQK